MWYKNRIMLQCKCTLKSLIGADVSKEMAESLIDLPVVRGCEREVVGNIDSVDYQNNSVAINLYAHIFPEIKLDGNGKASVLSVFLSKYLI